MGLDKTIYIYTHLHQISSQTKGQPQLDISPFHLTSILEKTRQQIFLFKKNTFQKSLNRITTRTQNFAAGTETFFPLHY